MCESCYRNVVDGRPWCAGCVSLLAQPTSPFPYVAFAGLMSALFVYLTLRFTPNLSLSLGGAIALLPVLTFCFTARRLFKKRERFRTSRVVHERQGAPMQQPIAGSPYRRNLPRAVRALELPISGASSALLMFTALALSASLIPLVFRLPAWIEAELVVGAWWAIWSLTLSTLLFRGFRLARDLQLYGEDKKDEVARVGKESATLKKEGASASDWLNLADVGTDAEGCLIAIGVIIVLGVLLSTGWIIAEIIIPLVVLFVFAMIVAALRRVARDRHDCQGNLGKSVLWGVFWATVYTAPIAGIVLAGQAYVHFVAPAFLQ